MTKKESARGGYVPGPPALCAAWVREDGFISFDGPDGPWSQILTPEQTRAYGAEALKAFKGSGVAWPS